MGDWLRYILSCCDEDERGEEERPALQIVSLIQARMPSSLISPLLTKSCRVLRPTSVARTSAFPASLPSSKPTHVATSIVQDS